MTDLEICLRAPGAALLVVAPHPDDESLATGGLLQRAVSAGARARVLLLTDGDNNPWPQRWLERRWRIGPEERRRWGQRRRGEAHAALATLGLPDDAPVCLGWPDMGVTSRLVDDTAASVSTIAGHVRDFAPSVLVFPSLGDTHPDHSAAHVLVRLALARQDCRLPHYTALLSYLIHGRRDPGSAVTLVLSGGEVQRKRDAVCAYQTQVTLSRSRLLANVSSAETYHSAAGNDVAAGANPWEAPAWLRGASELLVVAGEQAWRQPPGPVAGRETALARVLAAAPRPVAADCPVYVKLRLRQRSPWIFDRWGWRCLRGLTASGDSAKVDAPTLVTVD
ncbi:MAG TPA: PIG-L family deacetylase [Rhodanobacteraceae bacterium]|nr:PIG-L family deacetylase [Rhodanobacteraceae bacterium]